MNKLIRPNMTLGSLATLSVGHRFKVRVHKFGLLIYLPRMFKLFSKNTSVLPEHSIVPIIIDPVKAVADSLFPNSLRNSTYNAPTEAYATPNVKIWVMSADTITTHAHFLSRCCSPGLMFSVVSIEL